MHLRAGETKVEMPDQSKVRAMAAGEEGLPFIDRHAVEVEADPEATWKALESVLTRSFGSRSSGMTARVLGCVDTAGPGDRPLAEGTTIPGFRVLTFRPSSELTLAGRHRFSRYELVFRLTPAGTGRTQLSTETLAAFPGLRGSLYRGLIIGSRAHVLVNRRLLDAVKHGAER